MLQDKLLNLSIGDHIPDRRLSAKSYTGTVRLQGKSVRIDISADAVREADAGNQPVLAELELYFSCLVRKQLRFRRLHDQQTEGDGLVRVIPGFYTSFRAITTSHCAIVDAGGGVPVETMPVQHPERFVPDWIRIDYRARQWRGEYGFARRNVT